MDGVELMTRWFREVWTEERGDVIDELLSDDCVAHGLGPEPMVGPAAFKEWHQSLLAQFRVQIKVLQGIAQGDRVAVQSEATLTHRASGKSGTFTGCCLVTVRDDGKMTESTNEWNFVDLLEQIGVIPEAGLKTVLAGGKSTLPVWRA